MLRPNSFWSTLRLVALDNDAKPRMRRGAPGNAKNAAALRQYKGRRSADRVPARHIQVNTTCCDSRCICAHANGGRYLRRPLLLQ
jgi:hypothetical protein